MNMLSIQMAKRGINKTRHAPQVQAEVQAQLRAVSIQRQTLGVAVCKQPAPPSFAPAGSPVATSPSAS